MLRRIRRMTLVVASGLAIIAVVAFAADYAIFRLRVAKGWTPYGSVTVLHYDAVPQRNGKTELSSIRRRSKRASVRLFRTPAIRLAGI